MYKENINIFKVKLYASFEGFKEVFKQPIRELYARILF